MVHFFELSWREAAAIAVASALLSWVAFRQSGRRWRFVAPAAREWAVIMGLFTLWQVAGMLAITRVAGAFQKAHQILAIERAMHLPSEQSVQALVLPYPVIIQASNIFYLYVHINSITFFLIWLFVRHRDRYPWARNVLAVSTFFCLLIQLIAVAPPRMLPGAGFVDTATLYRQSIYGRFGTGVADQLSAMPSVHVLWAVLIALVVIRVSPSRWRWLILAHPVITTFVVVVTANHFWMDGIVAVAVLGVVLAGGWLGQRLWRARTVDLRSGADEEVPVAV